MKFSKTKIRKDNKMASSIETTDNITKVIEEVVSNGDYASDSEERVEPEKIDVHTDDEPSDVEENEETDAFEHTKTTPLKKVEFSLFDEIKKTIIKQIVITSLEIVKLDVSENIDIQDIFQVWHDKANVSVDDLNDYLAEVNNDHLLPKSKPKKATKPKIKLPTASKPIKKQVPINEDDDEEDKEDLKCEYIFVKGNNKGSKCPNKSKGSENGRSYCSKHIKGKK